MIHFYTTGQSNLLKALKLHYFLKLGFTKCNAKQPLQGMGLHEKEAQKD